MKKRHVYFYLLILIMLCLIAYFAIRKSSRKSTLKTEETAFSVNDTSSVYKIFYANKSGKKIVLERKGTNLWMVNNKYVARKDLIEITLITLHNLQIKSPASKAARNNAIRDMATRGIKVEIYQYEKEPNVFFVGETTPDELSTYFLMDGSENPYLVHLPGWDVNLRYRFFLDEWEWRSRLIFNLKPENFKKLRVTYLRMDSGSFTIFQEGNSYVMESKLKYSEEKIKTYLSKYNAIYMESFIKRNEKPGLKDSLLLYPPDCKIQLTEKNNKVTEIDIYHIKGNPDRMYGLLGKEQEMVTVQHFVFDELLLRSNDFL